MSLGALLLLANVRGFGFNLFSMGKQKLVKLLNEVFDWVCLVAITVAFIYSIINIAHVR
jgi:hypothetical protein